MEFEILENAISKERLNSYLNLAEGNKKKAVELYFYNLELCKALYNNLHWLEIILRNAINRIFIQDYNKSWYENPNINFAPIELNKIKQCILQIHQNKYDINNQNIVSNLNLGFWINIFSSYYETIWRHSLRKVFCKNKSIDRKTIHKKLHPLLKIRNRVAHYESILKFDLTKINQNIIDLIGLIEPNFCKKIILLNFKT